MNRLTTCPRCGADTISKLGIRKGQPVILVYDDNADHPHKFDCPASGARRELPKRAKVRARA